MKGAFALLEGGVNMKYSPLSPTRRRSDAERTRSRVSIALPGVRIL
jgi:hypothetical protein